MSQDLREVTQQVRRIPLEHVLAVQGLIPRKEGQTTRFKNDKLNIVVSGSDLWFDNAASIGGRGSIDLALHLHLGVRPKIASKEQFREAVLWLSAQKGGNTPSFFPTSTSSTKAKEPKESFEDQINRLAIRDESRWPQVKEYLTAKRKLPPGTIDQLYQAGEIYASFSEENPQSTGACFIHRDLNGAARGATIRSVEHQSNFRQCIGSKTNAWFSLGSIDQAKRIVATESPIEALSYQALYRPEQTWIVSCSGSYVFDHILKLSHDHKIELTVAFNNDSSKRLNAGENGFQKAEENLKTLYPDAPSPKEHRPLLNDWNDELRATFAQTKGFRR